MKPTQIKDFYERLGVARSASEEEIKKAYKKMAVEWHPDRNKSPDTETQFKAVSEAYKTLSDIRKKVLYDMFHPPTIKYEAPKPKTPTDHVYRAREEGFEVCTVCGKDKTIDLYV